MIRVTESALDALAQTLETNEVQEDQALRLARSGEGSFGLAIDDQREGDQVVAKDERPVLLIDGEISNQLDGVTLDLVESPQGRQLALRMPEETSS